MEEWRKDKRKNKSEKDEAAEDEEEDQEKEPKTGKNKKLIRLSRLKANSLVITVFISLLIGMLCLFLLLLTYYNRDLETIYKISKKLDLNIESGVQWVLADTSRFYNAQIDSVDLFGTQEDSVILTRNYWGHYNIALIRSFSGSRQKNKSFMYGVELPGQLDGCLYLADHKRPLYLVGNTNLEGKVYTSEAGIQAAYINQRGYDRLKLVKSNALRSKEMLPEIDSMRLVYLKQLLLSEHERVEYLPDSIDNSFDKEVMVFHMAGNVLLSGHNFEDNIVLIGDSSIEVEAGCQLNNIILAAPKITVHAGFKGRLQLVASDSINIGENCVLKYPSSVSLLKPGISTQPSYLVVGRGALVQGTIFGHSEQANNPAIFFTLSENAVAEGLVYLNGYCDLKGKVYGIVATDYFLYRSEAMLYENHLVDAELNRSRLFKNFAASAAIAGFNYQNMIQWLY